MRLIRQNRERFEGVICMYMGVGIYSDSAIGLVMTWIFSLFHFCKLLFFCVLFQ